MLPSFKDMHKADILYCLTLYTHAKQVDEAVKQWTDIQEVPASNLSRCIRCTS
jgi:hypothetical protein